MKIKNWKKFQHFKDRRPPWIKLHRDILEQRDISLLSDCSFRILVCLWLLASEDEDMEGELPTTADISFRLRMDEKKIVKHLQELTGFIEQDDINTISERYQLDEPETETEERESKKRPYGEHQKVMLTDKEFELIELYTGGRRTHYIDVLDSYIAQSGKRYKSHYATIQNFYRRDVEQGKVSEGQAIADINKYL